MQKLFVAAALMTALICLAAISPVSAQGPSPAADTWLVRFERGLALAQIDATLAAHNLERVKYDAGLNVYRVRPTAGGLRPGSPEALAADTHVRLVEPNLRVRATGLKHFPAPALLPAAPGANDPLFDQQWGLARIQAPLAWTLMQGATSSLTLAVIDTGIDATHPDLKARVIPGYNFVTPGAPPYDDYWHGTAVAGVAAAIQNNRIGIAGTALQARLMPLKVLDAEGNGTLADVARAIRYAAAHNARVVNMSLATSPDPAYLFCPGVLQEQINLAAARGVLLVAAAGNQGGTSPVFPAACENVFSAGSTGWDDQLSWFSNHGYWVDIVAPGENIISTVPGGDYLYGDGTSFSSPYVAGAAALLWQRRPGMTAEGVRRVLELTADRDGRVGRNNIFGWGRLNAAQAVIGKR